MVPFEFSEPATLCEVIALLGKSAVDEAALIADVHGTVSYKQQLLRACVGRAVRMALSNGGGI